MKVRIDPALCTGHGRCYEIAPAVFREDDYGHGWVERPEPPPSQWDKVRRAAQNCPEHAIRIDDGDVV